MSNSIYRYQVYRMTTQIRGYLISTIYDTVLQQESANDNQNNAMTLMSTDVEQICLTLKNLHEIWATFLELCIATYLLERQMKVACIVPLIIVLGTFHPWLSSSHSCSCCGLDSNYTIIFSIVGCQLCSIGTYDSYSKIMDSGYRSTFGFHE